MRYLLLVLLCIIVLPSAALAADSWAAGTADIPSPMLWDGSAGATVPVTNDGTTAWDSTFGLTAEQGGVAINRWGVQTAPVTVPTAAGADYEFNFDVVAPAITTLKYNLPITATSVPVTAGLSSDWIMSNAGTLITTDEVTGSTVVHRFSDTLTGLPAADWAIGEIEECAGRVPAITTGVTPTTFQPVTLVTRDQMAVFLQRALNLPMLAYEGKFVDAPDGFWAALQIEALARSGITTGVDPTHFQPTWPVDRATMAVFVARGLAGGESNVPKIPTDVAVQQFTDVPVDFWAYNHINYCVGANVVKGIGDGTYQPLTKVDRATMVVFMYRAFIRPTDSTVVLAGPAITHVNPATASYDGWSSTSVVRPGNMGSAYVGFDALRFQPATTPTPDVTVEFKLYAAADIVAGKPVAGALPVAQSGAVLVNKAAAQTDALVDGVPYAYASWALPDQAAGDYTLLTSVNGTLLAREPALQVNAAAASGPITAGLNTQAAIDATWDMVTGREISAGTEADMAVADGTYVETVRSTIPDDDWCDNGNYGNAIVWQGIPKDATSLQVTLKYYADNPDDGTWANQADCCASSCCGEWGTLDDWTDPAGHTPAYTFDTNGDGDPDYPNTAPLGWGLTVMTGAGGGYNWWDYDDAGVLQGSGDPMIPASTDFAGGGDMFPGEQGFTGFARTDTTQTWGTNYPAQYLNSNGDFAVVFCGGSIQTLKIDQAVLQYTLP